MHISKLSDDTLAYENNWKINWKKKRKKHMAVPINKEYFWMFFLSPCFSESLSENCNKNKFSEDTTTDPWLSDRDNFLIYEETKHFIIYGIFTVVQKLTPWTLRWELYPMSAQYWHSNGIIFEKSWLNSFIRALWL